MDYPSDQFEINQSEDGVLDSEFRRILWNIKQYIPYINSNYHLSLYRIWLEKLSCADSEKVERNIYLFELARQIKDNTLLPPFNEYPPSGSLKDLPKISHFRSSESTIPTQTTQTNTIWQDFEQPQQNPIQMAPYVEQNYYYPHQQQYQDNTTNAYYPPQPPQSNPYSFSYYTEPLDRFYYNFQNEGDDEACEPTVEQQRIPPKLRKRRLRNIPRGDLPSQNIPEEKDASRDFGDMPKNCAESGLVEESPSRDMPKNEEIPSPAPAQENKAVKEESSWCDLTDVDASITSIADSFASGDGQVKESIVQQRVQTFNDYRTVCEQSATELVKAETQNMERSNLNTEVDLTKKDQNLSTTPPTLKDTHFISADWKKTIEALQLRLTETLNQNNELKAIIKSLQMKMQEEAAKHKEDNQKITIEHNQEIEALKQLQAENIKKLEKSFQIKLDEAERNYHHKIDKIKLSYESKTKELKTEHESSRKEKDREIARLTDIIQQQCTRMSNEISALRHHLENSLPNGNDEKITVLQKCVSKMDRLFQKSEKEYQKQLEKLKQELELKDKVMQIQLKTQRAELITRTSAEKQKQFDDVINNLEIKYIKMLEYHEAQVMESRKHDEEKIERLLNLLDKNDISCDFM